MAFSCSSKWQIHTNHYKPCWSCVSLDSVSAAFPPFRLGISPPWPAFGRRLAPTATFLWHLPLQCPELAQTLGGYLKGCSCVWDSELLFEDDTDTNKQMMSTKNWPHEFHTFIQIPKKNIYTVKIKKKSIWMWPRHFNHECESVIW